MLSRTPRGEGPCQHLDLCCFSPCCVICEGSPRKSMHWVQVGYGNLHFKPEPSVTLASGWHLRKHWPGELLCYWTLKSIRIINSEEEEGQAQTSGRHKMRQEKNKIWPPGWSCLTAPLNFSLEEQSRSDVIRIIFFSSFKFMTLWILTKLPCRWKRSRWMRPKWCPKGWHGGSLFWRRKKGIYTSGGSEDSAPLSARPISSTGSMPGSCSSLQLGAFLSFLQRIFWNSNTSLKFCWINYCHNLTFLPVCTNGLANKTHS